MNTINTKKSVISFFKFVLPLVVILLVQAATNAQSYTPEEQNCFSMVQGKVAWDKAGTSKNWVEANVRSLCKGTSNPAATIACFRNIVGADGDYGRGIKECPAQSQNQPYFADGTKVVLQADNGDVMSRCNGCLSNRGGADNILLFSGESHPFDTFTVKNVGRKTLLIADTGGAIGYCNGCVNGGTVADFLFVGAADNPFGQFELTKLSNGKYSLLAPNGKYVTRCNGCAPGSKYENVVTAHANNANDGPAQWTITPPDAVSWRKLRTFDQYAWLTSHNSFVNYSDARWAAPNQSRGIIGQIETDGVRGLMLDVYDFSGSNPVTCGVSFGSDCYKAGVYLCHGGCSGFPGSTYALPRQNLKDTLDAIGDWLAKNRGLKDVITIFFEDYTSGGTLASVIRNSKAAPYVFNPYGSWKVSAKGFPTLEYLQSKDQRLIILTSKGENKDTSLGLAHDQDFDVENYWSIGAGGANYECKTRWSSIDLNRTETNFKRLFVMNHFRDVPSTPTAAFDNNESNLKDRLTRCQTAAGRLPNFLALDFIELGSGKTLVDSINAEWAKQIK